MLHVDMIAASSLTVPILLTLFCSASTYEYREDGSISDTYISDVTWFRVVTYVAPARINSIVFDCISVETVRR